MIDTRTTNVFWHHGAITRTDREHTNRHKSCIIWLSGLSGSGKTTIAYKLEEKLFQRGVRSYVLDGDNIRQGLNKNLGFSKEDREENIRRIGEVAKLFVDAGIIAITAFISPYRKDRDRVRSIVKEGDFIECYVRCSIECCEKRDTKGLWGRARRGEVKEFTGISAPYEEPLNPELILDTENETIEESQSKIMKYLIAKGYIEDRRQETEDTKVRTKK
ncbi:MAG: adenylyl-sulfate kinase [Candidatus Hydrogenedentota bacterium]